MQGRNGFDQRMR